MRVDIYRRPEPDALYSYLVVPEGQPIPEEAMNTDWASHGQAMEVDEGAETLEEFGIPEPGQQIAEKGYAITSVNSQQH